MSTKRSSTCSGRAACCPHRHRLRHTVAQMMRVSLKRKELITPPNTQMEPTRLAVCAIMSPRRAAHLDR